MAVFQRIDLQSGWATIDQTRPFVAGGPESHFAIKMLHCRESADIRDVRNLAHLQRLADAIAGPGSAIPVKPHSAALAWEPPFFPLLIWNATFQDGLVL